MRWKRKGEWEPTSLRRGFHLYLNGQGVAPPVAPPAPCSLLTASERLPSVTQRERRTQVIMPPLPPHQSRSSPGTHVSPKHEQGWGCQSGGTAQSPASLGPRLSTQGSLSSPSPGGQPPFPSGLLQSGISQPLREHATRTSWEGIAERHLWLAKSPRSCSPTKWPPRTPPVTTDCIASLSQHLGLPSRTSSAQERKPCLPS